MFHVEQPDTTEAGRRGSGGTGAGAGSGGTGAGAGSGGTVEGRGGRALQHSECR